MKHLLDFEKPYIDLQRRLEELREQPEETDVPLDIGMKSAARGED